MPHIHRFALWSLAVLLSVPIMVSTAPSASAQSPVIANIGEGLTLATQWPDRSVRHDLSHDLLPFIDTLFVAYHYATEAGEPSMGLSVEWVPSGDVIFAGERRDVSSIDGEIKMMAIELELAVYTQGLRAGTFSVIVDSMVLGASPDYVGIALTDMSWEDVFVDVTGAEARHLFAQGFELREPEIERVAFAVVGEDGRITEMRGDPTGGRRPQARKASVYDRRARVGIGFDIFGFLGSSGRIDRRNTPRGSVGRGGLDDRPRSRAAGTGEERTARAYENDARNGGDARNAGEGQNAGEGRHAGEAKNAGEVGAGERSGSTGDDRPAGGGDRERARDTDRGARSVLDALSRNEDDEDEDDDDKLVPYAMAAVGAAGLLAFAGGTIGYFGNIRHARYGVTTGLVRRDGGLLLQVGVNEALIADDGRPKRLMAKLLAFGRLFDGNVQPALGAGVLAVSRGAEVTTEPSISLGAVARHHALLLYGGYDFYQHGVEFGVALNVRDLGFWKAGRERRE